jgi:aromatic-L-amino-acid decarboxylase
MVDQVADYLEGIEKYPVLSRVKPGEVSGALPARAPQHGECKEGQEQEFIAAVMRDVHGIIMPGITHWQHPGFMAYFAANTSPPAVLAEILSAGLGVQGMLWATSPACTELEQRMMDWLGSAIGLPDKFMFWPQGGERDVDGSTVRTGSTGRGGGVIAGTASESTLIAMLAARARARTLYNVHNDYVVYTSTQAHSSVLKAAMIAGIARDAQDVSLQTQRTAGVRMIATDGACRMDVRSLRAAIAYDLSVGRVPLMISATVGTTGVTAVDPVEMLAHEARQHNIWLHVDAAHSGAACICPEHRWMIEGVSGADSFCFNPHKWLLTNFDCGCLWIADRAPLMAALSVTPEYLRNTASDSGSVIDYRDWQIPLGRRFRALKLWFVMRCYGVEGLQRYINNHIVLAEMFEALVRSDDRFEVTDTRTVNLVCLRLREGDEATRALMNRINATGNYYVTHTMLPPEHAVAPGALVIRVAISGTSTQERHVRGLWEMMRAGAGGQGGRRQETGDRRGRGERGY